MTENVVPAPMPDEPRGASQKRSSSHKGSGSPTPQPGESSQPAQASNSALSEPATHAQEVTPGPIAEDPVTDIKAILRSVVTADEIADRYKLKGKKVRSAVKKGSLPARKAGKVLLMRRDDARALWGKKGDPKAQQPAGPQHKVLDEVVVLEEAAKEYGLKAKRLRKAAKAGKLSARKAGKHWLIRRADVEPVADR